MTTDSERSLVSSSVGFARLGHARRHQHLENNMQLTRIGAALLLAILPVAALAQGTAPPSSAAATSAGRSPALKEARAKMRAACAADVQKFCDSVERGKV